MTCGEVWHRASATGKEYGFCKYPKGHHGNHLTPEGTEWEPGGRTVPRSPAMTRQQRARALRQARVLATIGAQETRWCVPTEGDAAIFGWDFHRVFQWPMGECYAVAASLVLDGYPVRGGPVSREPG